MTTTELERLVVKLVADVDGYTKNMDNAAATAESTSKKIIDSIENAGESIKKLGASVAGLISAWGVKQWLGEGKDSWRDYESTVQKLTSVLKANGRDVKPLIKDYQDFASAVQDMTTKSDDEVLMLLKKAELFGLTGEAAKTATQDALAMAAATDLSPEMTMRVSAAMSKGNTKEALQFGHMLGRSLPQFRTIKTQSEFIAEYTKLIAAGHQTISDEMNTAAGRAKQWANVYGDMMKEVGRIIDKVAVPTEKFLRKSVRQWFMHLSEGTKTAIVGAAATATGILGMSAALGVLKPIIPVVKSGLMTMLSVLNALPFSISRIVAILKVARTAVAFMFGPWGIALVLVSTLVALVVQKLGGLDKALDNIVTIGSDAWDTIKSKAKEFWEWLKPVRQALVSLWKTAWKMVSEGAEIAWKFIKDVIQDFRSWVTEVWGKMVGDAIGSWDTIRDGIRDAILFAEFTLKNFEQVSSAVWAYAKYQFIKFSAEVEYFFKEYLPAAFGWLKDNWTAIMNGIVEFGIRVWDLQAEAIVETFKAIPWGTLWDGYKEAVKFQIDLTVQAFKAIPALIKGKMKIEDVFAEQANDAGQQAAEAIQQGAQKKLRDKAANIGEGLFGGVGGFKPPPRVIQEAERAAKEEWEKLRDKVGVDFAEFRKQKLAEFGLDAAGEDATKKGKGIFDKTGASAKAAEKEIHKFDAALAGSAEAASRIAAYRDKIASGAEGGSTTGSGVSGGKESTGANKEALDKQTAQIQILKDIRDDIRSGNKTGGLVKAEAAKLVA